MNEHLTKRIHKPKFVIFVIISNLEAKRDRCKKICKEEEKKAKCPRHEAGEEMYMKGHVCNA